MNWTLLDPVVRPIDANAARWFATDLLGLMRFRDVDFGMVLVGVQWVRHGSNPERAIVADGMTRSDVQAHIRAALALVAEQYAVAQPVEYEVRVWRVVDPDALVGIPA